MTTRAAQQPEHDRTALRARTWRSGRGPHRVREDTGTERPKSLTGSGGGRPPETRRPWGRALLRAFAMVCAFVLLVAFSAVLAKLTLTPSPASDGIAGSNLRPGHSLRQYAEEYTFLAACKQAGGNLLLGAPFGVLVPLLVPGRLRVVRVFFVALLVMVLVEMAQGAVIEGRAFDVDDVILNTTGALLGYWLLGRRLARSLQRRTAPVVVNRPEPVPEPAAVSADTSEPPHGVSRTERLRSTWRSSRLSRRSRPAGPPPEGGKLSAD